MQILYALVKKQREISAICNFWP